MLYSTFSDFTISLTVKCCHIY